MAKRVPIADCRNFRKFRESEAEVHIASANLARFKVPWTGQLGMQLRLPAAVEGITAVELPARRLRTDSINGFFGKEVSLWSVLPTTH
jgi:hypothetical protein